MDSHNDDQVEQNRRDIRDMRTSDTNFRKDQQIRQDEVTINLMSMIQMLNNNINMSRKELIDEVNSNKAEILEELRKHEEAEMLEISAIRKDIGDLQTWKWRLIGLLGAVVLLGLISQDTLDKIGHITGVLGGG